MAKWTSEVFRTGPLWQIHCKSLPFVSRAALRSHLSHNWCNDTLIHFIAGNIGRWSIHAGSLQNFYSLLLILLQLKRLRRNFPGTTELTMIQEEPRTVASSCHLQVMLLKRFTERLWHYGLLKFVKATLDFQWSFGHSSLLLCRTAPSFWPEEPWPLACTPQPWPTHATLPGLLAEAI